MELKVINDKGEAQKSVDASETLFGREYNEALVHQDKACALQRYRDLLREFPDDPVADVMVKRLSA